MNYNMQGMETTIPELYSMLKSTEVEIKKKHQVLMVNKTTSFKKGKGKKSLKKDDKAVARPVNQLLGRSQRKDPSSRLSAITAREPVSGSGIAPST